jgi:hypothetical protein
MFLPLERPNGTAAHDEQIGLTVGRNLADFILGVPDHHLRLHLHLHRETIPNRLDRKKGQE